VAATKIDKCRVCYSTDLFNFIDLGEVPVADNFTKNLDTEVKYRLSVNFCQTCGWSQLSSVLDPKFLYQNDYPYDSRMTITGKAHWHELASSVKEIYGFKIGEKCLDVGSNTGALLSEFESLGFKVTGVDPSEVAVLEAEKFGISTACTFFEKIDPLINKFGLTPESYSIVTATNSFAHVDDLHSWIRNASSFMHEYGVLIIEVPHILKLVQGLQFDTIYHEHLSYCSVTPLISLFSKFGLEIVRVDSREMHGGTIRIHAAKLGKRPIDSSVAKILKEEFAFGLNTKEVYVDFASKVISLRESFRSYMDSVADRKVAILSAPAKGVTFYHYMGIDSHKIIGISDKSHFKVGKFFPGTNLRVVSDLELAHLNPDIILVLAWNFAEEIIGDFKPLLGNHAIFVTSVPTIVII
jgi:SAM-dependent methyltransferase